MGSEGTPEVRVKLVIDSDSKKVAEEVKKDLHGIEGHATEAGHEAGEGMWKEFFKADLYMEIAKKAVEVGKEMFVAPIEAYMESAAQIKAIAGTFAAIDRGGHSFQTLSGYANDTRIELEELGMAVGVSDEALVQMFTDIIERGGKSVEKAKELTTQMAIAGRAIPGGGKAMAEGLSMIELGIIRARNPMVQMIAQTGVLKGTAKQVAAEMLKMPIDKQMEIAEKAVAKMSEKMKNVPMTMVEAVASLKVLGGSMLKEMGEPMTKGLSKAVLEFRSVFIDAHGHATATATALINAGKMMGEYMANAFKLAGPFIQGFTDGASVFSEETKGMMEMLFGENISFWKTLQQIARGVGEVLGFAAKMTAFAIGGQLNSMRNVAVFFYEVITRGAGLVVEILGKALAGWGSVIKQLPGGGKVGSAMETAGDFGDEAGRAAQHAGLKFKEDDLLEKAKQTGGGDINTLKAQYAETSKVWATSYEEQMAANAKFEQAAQERIDMEQTITTARENAGDDSAQGAEYYLKQFEKASNAHDEAAQLQITKFLGENEKMATAIGELAPNIIEGGVSSFVEALKKTGNIKMAEVIEAHQKKDFGAGTMKTASPINFNGGQKFEIKQDFRDQDPDRVATVFKRDIERAATNRAQSKLSNAFGF